MSLGSSEWLCLPFSSHILHRNYFGYPFWFDYATKSISETSDWENIQKCLYFWTGSFPRVPGNTIPREWGGVGEEGGRAEKGNWGEREQVYYTRLIISSFRAVYLFISSKFAEQGKCTLRKSCSNNIPDFKFQLSQVRKLTATSINRIKCIHGHFQFGDTVVHRIDNRIGVVLQRKKDIDLVQISQYHLLS